MARHHYCGGRVYRWSTVVSVPLALVTVVLNQERQLHKRNLLLQVGIYVGYIATCNHTSLTLAMDAAFKNLDRFRTHDMLNVVRGACLSHAWSTERWRHVAMLFGANTWQLVDLPEAVSQLLMVYDLVKLKYAVELLPRSLYI